MTLFGKEHYEMMEIFERIVYGRKDREPKELWSKGVVYCDGDVNKQFLIFRQGVAYGRTLID